MQFVSVSLRHSDWAVITEQLIRLKDSFERTLHYYEGVGTIEEIGFTNGDVASEEEALTAIMYVSYLMDSIEQQVRFSAVA